MNTCLHVDELSKFIWTVGFKIGFITDEYVELVTREKTFIWGKLADTDVWCLLGSGILG